MSDRCARCGHVDRAHDDGPCAVQGRREMFEETEPDECGCPGFVDSVVDMIGEQFFRAADDCLGHGDPHLSHEWAMALTVRQGLGAPRGFKFIVDAELTPVALVPEKLVEGFLALLNAEEG